jgi:hypothetical protein
MIDNLMSAAYFLLNDLLNWEDVGVIEFAQQVRCVFKNSFFNYLTLIPT